MGTLINSCPMVLIADDEEDLLLLMTNRLSKDGFRVVVSPNGENIQEMARSLHPDIILLDISKNGKNGSDICNKLKANLFTNNIPIVMFSANDDIDKITKACGADGWLAKPFNPIIMEQKLIELLDRA